LYDSGSSIGGAIAPFIILPVYLRWGWRAAFVIPGVLGFLWLIVWRYMYYLPQEHPRISKEELQIILADHEEDERDRKPPARWLDLLKLPQTWGVIVSKALTDPVWFFIADWFPIYLVAKGISLKSGLIAIWIPFLAADLGNFFGGAVSDYLIRRGWPLGRARKSMVVFGGFGVLLLIPTIFTVNLYLITLLFALATFAYAAFSTIANVLPTDLYTSGSVASVSGMSGTGAGIGTIIAFKLIGYFSDARQAATTHSFDPIVIVAGMIPFVGMILVLLLVRNTRTTDQGLVKRI
jgi:ACS family hexuronate transporter-like MFS transporter